MNKHIKLLAGVGLAVLLLTTVLATSAFAQGGTPYGQQGRQGWGGMMGGWRSNQQPSAPITGAAPSGGYGCGMVGGWETPANGNPISMDQALTAAQQYVAGYNNQDLALAEIMEFADNFYVQAKEKSTGNGAFELLVNRYSGAVYPEMGPNMMWNTKYGHMGQGGMMGATLAPGLRPGASAGVGGLWGNRQAGPLTVTEQQARANAQQYLDANFAGAQVADEATTFYGYYTYDFLQNGQVAGMLSVNGYSGQVWYHSWHGAFVAEKEL